MKPGALLSKQRFGTFVIVVSLLNLFGCASQIREKRSVQDLRSYKVDCTIKDQQREFLERSRPTRHEEQMARLELRTIGMFSSDIEHKRQIANGNIGFWYDQLLTEIERCPSKS